MARVSKPREAVLFFGDPELRRNNPHQKQRQKTQQRSGKEHKAIVDEPQHTSKGRQKDSCYVVDGKPHSHTRGYILGVSNFLKEGSDTNGEVEEEVVGDIEKQSDLS